MNSKFRTWVDTHAKMIAVNPTIAQVSPMSMLLFPSFFVLGFVNEYFLSPYLPEPKLWDMQIQAELQFQSTHFVEESKQSLERIKSSFPWTPGQNETLMQRLNVMADRITANQQGLNQTIETLKHDYPFWRLGRESREVEKLRLIDELESRMLIAIYGIKRSVQAWEEASNNLIVGLSLIDRSIDRTAAFDFSPRGLVTIPAILSVEMEKIFFLRREQNPSPSHLKQTKSSTDYHFYKDDLSAVNDLDIFTRRNAIVKFCKDSESYIIDNGFLYTTCNIWKHAKRLSNLDIDLLSGEPRYWARERLAAYHPWSTANGIFNELLALPRIGRPGAQVAEVL